MISWYYFDETKKRHEHKVLRSYELSFRKNWQ
jgi:hypothetical protein